MSVFLAWTIAVAATIRRTLGVAGGDAAAAGSFGAVGGVGVGGVGVGCGGDGGFGAAGAGARVRGEEIGAFGVVDPVPGGVSEWWLFGKGIWRGGREKGGGGGLVPFDGELAIGHVCERVPG